MGSDTVSISQCPNPALHSVSFVLSVCSVVLAGSGTLIAQTHDQTDPATACWAIDATNGAMKVSDTRPNSADPNQAVLLEEERKLQKLMGIDAKIFTVEGRRTYSSPKTGN